MEPIEPRVIPSKSRFSPKAQQQERLPFSASRHRILPRSTREIPGNTWQHPKQVLREPNRNSPETCIHHRSMMQTIIGDESRFDYQKQCARNRSRNTTPTNLAGLGVLYPPDTWSTSRAAQSPGQSPFHDPVPHDNLMSGHLARYSTNKALPAVPAPSPRELAERILGGTQADVFSSEQDAGLPPALTTKEYLASSRPGRPSPRPGAELVEAVWGRVLRRSLFRITRRGAHVLPGVKGTVFDDPAESYHAFTLANLAESVQIVLNAIVITTSCIQLTRDTAVSARIYHFLIATAVISVIGALGFLFRIVRIEQSRKLVAVICSAQCVFGAIAFTLSILNLASNCTAKGSVCTVRRTTTAFVTLSFLMWLMVSAAYATLYCMAGRRT